MITWQFEKAVESQGWKLLWIRRYLQSVRMEWMLSDDPVWTERSLWWEETW